MKRGRKALCAVLLLLMATACGPIIGGIMVAGAGVKDFAVTEGSLADFGGGATLAVLGPFAKTDQAFYICRGEEAASFAHELSVAGLFRAELALTERFPDRLPTAADWQGQSPARVQAALGLDQPPAWLLGGTILTREMVTAPAQGVLMHVAYRLEFLELASGRTVVVEVEAKDLFQDVIPAVVAELQQRARG